MKKNALSTRIGTLLFRLMAAVFTVLILYMASSGRSCQDPIALDVLRREFPQMIFSALCLLLGLVTAVFSLYFHYFMKASDSSMMSLGLVSVFLGLWKITDLSSLPLLFPEAAMAIRCLCVCALLLTGLCLMLYFGSLIRCGTDSILLILPAGIILDLLPHRAGHLIFTMAGFTFYTLLIFICSVRRATRRAYTDVCTGLVNRIRWDDMMYSGAAIAEPYCFLMIDLNGLKHVNDTLGHGAGDRMIFRLADLLRSTLPRSAMICRWGGDEFTVLMHGVTRPMLDRHIEELFTAADRHNADQPELPIHFSLGAALSSEHPGASKTELFRLADEDMYRKKQMWYAAR